MSGDQVGELRCKALLFDMDGVLVDSRAVVERIWRRWSARHGIDADEVLRVAHGRRTSETLQHVAPHLPTGDEVAWLDAAELSDLDGLQAVAGASELLASLREIPWALVTSAGRELALRRMAAAGLPEPYVLVASEDVARGKPAPDGYLIAAMRLALQPEHAVVFEDAPPGIAAARAAGCAVIGVGTTHPASELAGTAFVVPDLRSVSVARDAVGWRVFMVRRPPTGTACRSSSPRT